MGAVGNVELLTIRQIHRIFIAHVPCAHLLPQQLPEMGSCHDCGDSFHLVRVAVSERKRLQFGIYNNQCHEPSHSGMVGLQVKRAVSSGHHSDCRLLQVKWGKDRRAKTGVHDHKGGFLHGKCLPHTVESDLAGKRGVGT